ncbi:MAG: hypothetical protein RI947_1092 [Candidatus Parcubacteria bacterium]|jgi:hypothetical protein
MDKFILTLTQAQEYIHNATYDLNHSTKYYSRCIDGRYESNNTLPAMAIAGGDAGELAIFIAASNIYGFEIDAEKCMNILTDIVGGYEHLGFHTDTHAKDAVGCAGCGHLKQMRLDPATYNLTEDNIKTINNLVQKSLKKGAKEVVLQGDHHEAAVFIVNGPYGILPQAQLQTDDGSLPVQAFVAHKSLVDARHVELCERLVAEGVIKLAEGLGEEYLYESVSQVSDDHLMETAKRLAGGLPIFSVKFKDDGTFQLEDMGTVSP